MYLRTTKRRNADGSEVCYYQLADNVWDPQRKCSVATVVYNFGRGDVRRRWMDERRAALVRAAEERVVRRYAVAP